MRRFSITALILSLFLALTFFSCSSGEKGAKDGRTESFKLNEQTDLNNLSIGVLLGSTHDAFCTKTYPNAEIKRFDQSADIIIALQTGTCDVVMMDNSTAAFSINENPEIGFLKENVYTEPFGFGFRDPQLCNKFNSFLKELREKGELDRIYNIWEKEDSLAVLPTIPDKKYDGVLNVYTTGVMVPVSYMRNGELVGNDVDLAIRFALTQNLKPVFTTVTFSSLIASIASSKADIIACGITITEERAKQVIFSDVYYESKSSILALNKNIDKNKDKAVDLTDYVKGKRIGVLMGSTQDSYALHHFTESTICRIDMISDLKMMLQSGQCDAILISKECATFLAEDHSNFTCFEDDLLSDTLSIGFPLEKPEMVNEFNAFIDEMRKSGEYDDIYDRWIRNAEDSEMPVIANSGKNGKITIGTTAESMPFSFFKDGKVAGFDIELMCRFAAKLEMTPDFYICNFSGLIPSIQTGRTDLIANCIMVTPERSEQVLFSQGYITVSTILVVNNQNLSESEGADAENILVSDGSNGSSAGHKIAGWVASVKNSFYNNIIREKRYMLLWDGLKVTVWISILSALLGTLLGGVVCFMRMSNNMIIRSIAKIYIDLLRGTPQVVLLMIMFYVVFASSDMSGALIASITFAMNFAAYTSEMFRTSIESVGKGQTEAGIAMGFSKVKTFVYIILPQAARHVIPVYKGEFISLVKMTAIVGYIAVQDLTKASDIIRSRTFDAFFPLIVVAVLYFVLARILGRLLDFVSFKIQPNKGCKKE